MHFRPLLMIPVSVAILAIVMCSTTHAGQLLCPPDAEYILHNSINKGEWKPVYEGRLKEVRMTFWDLKQFGMITTVECWRQRGVMIVKQQGTCRFIFGEGKFTRDTSLIRGVDQKCELEDKADSKTNDQQCIIECD